MCRRAVAGLRSCRGERRPTSCSCQDQPRPQAILCYGFSDIHGQLTRAFPGDSIDLAFLRNVDPLFRWEIVRDGRLLWGDPVDFLEYRAFAFRDYVDSADLRALERALFLKKMAMIHRVLDAAA